MPPDYEREFTRNPATEHSKSGSIPRHARYCSFPSVNSATISHQTRRLPAATFSCGTGELTESNSSRRLPEQTYLGRNLACGQWIVFFWFRFSLKVCKYPLEGLPRERIPAHERGECFGRSECSGYHACAARQSLRYCGPTYRHSL